MAWGGQNSPEKAPKGQKGPQKFHALDQFERLTSLRQFQLKKIKPAATVMKKIITCSNNYGTK